MTIEAYPVLLARPSVPALDAILGYAAPVLDHGFIRVIDYMGDDAAVVQAARVSYGAGTETPSSDAALINYLMRHRHTTPFEMCEIKFHVKLPIFVARQWIRHRMANVNEYSARYSILDREFYIPQPDQVQRQSTSNKQGRDGELPGDLVEVFRKGLLADSNYLFDQYEAVSDADIARETARMGLPLNTYTQWYWKVDLHNLMNFLVLRADPHAQWEIRMYADIMLDIIKQWVPASFAAFEEHRLGAATFSKSALAVLQRLARSEPTVVRLFSEQLSKRERGDFLRILGI